MVTNSKPVSYKVCTLNIAWLKVLIYPYLELARVQRAMSSSSRAEVTKLFCLIDPLPGPNNEFVVALSSLRALVHMTWPSCHEFKPSAAEDPPCGGVGARRGSVEAQSPPTGVMM
ncbi:hypothetical protein TNCV_4292791 [Trichonephila clavipes]|uniref:Uncharacterized protein n=1 Tax=Trichonephila clavipes TaxID=2585209 RepID=A0A8X6RKG8_TRICX|nr:hypothetical protein TNCV_4292791 [Trichonephila clavipes]